MLGVVAFTEQDFALLLVELHEVLFSPLLLCIEVTPDGSTTLLCISHPSQSCVSSKLPGLLLSLTYLQKLFLLSLTYLTRFSPSWDSAFLIACVYSDSVFLPGYLSWVLPFIWFSIFVFKFGQDLVVHPHRLPSICA